MIKQQIKETDTERQKDTEKHKETIPKRHPLTSSLLKAAYEGDVSRVKTFLNEGVPVDACNSAGLRALHFVAKSGQSEVAVELVRRGADVNAVSLKGHSPLHVACLLGHKEIVKVLLQQRAEVNAQSKCHDDDFTPLYMASQIGDQEVVSLLLAHGADPTLTTKNGCTAKDVASQQGFTFLAQLLHECEKRFEGHRTPTHTSPHHPSTPNNHSTTPTNLSSTHSSTNLTQTSPTHHPSTSPTRHPSTAPLKSVHKPPCKHHLANRLLHKNLPPSIYQYDVIRSPGNYPSPIRPPSLIHHPHPHNDAS